MNFSQPSTTNTCSKTLNNLNFIVHITPPDYLQGRPKQTILHCLHRQASSNKFASSDIIHISPSLPKFEVKGAKGTHIVDFGEPSCSCKEWITHHIPCKHFFAVFNHYPQWGWDQLPSSYKASPYLSLDNVTMSNYIASETGLPDQMDDHNGDNNTPSTTFDQIPRKVRVYRMIIYFTATL